MDKRDLPLGFGMALAQNEPAMQAFEALGEDEKEAIIARTHSVRSKNEMEQLVESLVTPPHLGDQNFPFRGNFPYTQ